MILGIDVLSIACKFFAGILIASALFAGYLLVKLKYKCYKKRYFVLIIAMIALYLALGCFLFSI